MTAQGVPTLRIDGAIDAAGLVTLAREDLRPVLASYLPGQRWYGDKARPVASVAVDDLVAAASGDEWFLLVVVAVHFAVAAEPVRYFLPLAVGREAVPEAAVLARLETDDGRRFVADAFASPAFPGWLLDQLAGDARLPAASGEFRWQRLPELAEHLAAARSGPVRVGSAEQSNSALLYDAALFLKVFRKLRAGVNPDEEVTRHLASRTPFRRLPLPLGVAAYVAPDGSRYPVALAQSFVPSVGDGWSFTLDALAGLIQAAADGGASVPSGPYAKAAHLLGERTGQLHLALAQDATDPAFAPEPIAPADVERWEADVLAKLRATEADLRRRAADLPPALRARIAGFSERLPELERRASGFRAQLGTFKTRVHGDYHLGQVLRTPDDDWVTLDFEGEPARPIAERRAKTSPLKDVAGMLRSFGYARGAALRAQPPGAEPRGAGRLLEAWEAAARAAFLDGYLTEVRRGGVPIVPTEPEGFAAAIGAWELDKALYEVAYELGNRPDWLDLPLAALAADAPPSGAAGGA